MTCSLHYSLSLDERIGLAMKHSGVAITITSMTDFLAFGIGATSALPALANFCAYSAFSICAVFLNMASFFLACLVIDQRRIDAKRDGIFCCFKKDKYWIPNKCSQTSLIGVIFKVYADVVVKTPFKFGVITLSIVLTLTSCYGVSQLESKFDLIDWFPPDSVVVKYLREKEKLFPAGGIKGKIYVLEIPSVETKLVMLHKLLETVGNVPDLKENKINSFLPHFFEYMSLKEKELYLNSTSNLPQFLEYMTFNAKTLETLSKREVREHLRDFLCSYGRIWQNDIMYEGRMTLDCSVMMRIPPIRMMTFGYQHKRYRHF